MLQCNDPSAGEVTVSNVEQAPVIHPTLEEMEDMVDLLERLAPVAAAHGAIRIDPPKTWPAPALRMASDSRFFVRLQSLPAPELPLTEPVVFPDSAMPVELSAFQKEALLFQKKVRRKLFPNGIAVSENDPDADANALELAFWNAISNGICGEKVDIPYGVDVEAEGAWDSTERTYVDWRDADVVPLSLAPATEPKIKRVKKSKKRRRPTNTNSEHSNAQQCLNDKNDDQNTKVEEHIGPPLKRVAAKGDRVEEQGTRRLQEPLPQEASPGNTEQVVQDQAQICQIAPAEAPRLQPLPQIGKSNHVKVETGLDRSVAGGTSMSRATPLVTSPEAAAPLPVSSVIPPAAPSAALQQTGLASSSTVTSMAPSVAPSAASFAAPLEAPKAALQSVSQPVSQPASQSALQPAPQPAPQPVALLAPLPESVAVPPGVASAKSPLTAPLITSAPPESLTQSVEAQMQSADPPPAGNLTNENTTRDAMPSTQAIDKYQATIAQGISPTNMVGSPESVSPKEAGQVDEAPAVSKMDPKKPKPQERTETMEAMEVEKPAAAQEAEPPKAVTVSALTCTKQAAKTKKSLQTDNSTQIPDPGQTTKRNDSTVITLPVRTRLQSLPQSVEGGNEEEQVLDSGDAQADMAPPSMLHELASSVSPSLDGSDPTISKSTAGMQRDAIESAQSNGVNENEVLPQPPARKAPKSHVGNINRGGVLRHLPRMPGINHSMYYIGQLFTRFCWHTEDAYLNSVSYLHPGSAEKVWYAVPPDNATEVEAYATENVFAPCMYSRGETGTSLIMNKTTIFNPAELLRRGIKVYKVIHKPGSFVLTAPRAYHAGFNCGFNVAEAVNFATANWFPTGRIAAACARALRRPLCVPREYLLYHEAQTLKRVMDEHGVKKLQENKRLVGNAQIIAGELQTVMDEGENAIRRYANSSGCRVAYLSDVQVVMKEPQLGPEFGNGAGVVCGACGHAAHFYAAVCGTCTDNIEARCPQHFDRGGSICDTSGHQMIVVRRHDPIHLIDLLGEIERLAGRRVSPEEQLKRFKVFVRPWDTPRRTCGLHLRMNLVEGATRNATVPVKKTSKKRRRESDVVQRKQRRVSQAPPGGGMMSSSGIAENATVLRERRSSERSESEMSNSTDVLNAESIVNSPG